MTNDRDYWLQQDLAASRRRNNSVDSNGIFDSDSYHYFKPVLGHG